MTKPSGRFATLISSIAQRKIVTPYLDLAMTGDKWPDHYDIRVDSRPYYGIVDGVPDGYFHPSTHSLKPARLLWYMMHPDYRDKLEREPFSMQQQMTFAMGSALHAVVQTQFQMIGLCRPNDENGDSPDIEVEYVNADHHVRGRNDFVLNHPTEGRIPIELKTFNTIGFGKLDATEETMKPEWKAQLSLALDNLGYPFGILLVFQAGWPYRFEEIRYNRDDKLLTEIYTKFDEVREHLALDTPPQYCCSYGSKTMKSCPARYVCWLALEKASKGVTSELQR